MTDVPKPSNHGLNPLPLLGELEFNEKSDTYTPLYVQPPLVGRSETQAPVAAPLAPSNSSNVLRLAQRAAIGALLLLGGWFLNSYVGSAPHLIPTVAAATTASGAMAATDADIEIKGESERDEELRHYTLTGHMTNTSLLNAPAVELDAVFHYGIHDADKNYQDGPTISIPLDTFRNLRPGETRDFNSAAAFQKVVPGYGNYPCYGNTNGWSLDCGDTMTPVPYKVTVAAHVTPNP